MRKILFLIFLIACMATISGQELNCLVTINSDQIPGSNKQIFSTLEKSISEFINQKKWTSRNVKPQERINCAMTIIITSWESGQFKGTIQIQSTRPVFGTAYASPVLNLKDNDFSFRYNEFDQLIYNPTRFDSNLISTIAFYVYIILGVDADTFALKGGQSYYKQAENSMLQAQQSGLATWQNKVGDQNKFMLIDNLLSTKLTQYRSVLYNYHRNGLDKMVNDNKNAKQRIENSVISMESLLNKTISNFLIRVFFDAKSDEIVNMYSDGPNTRSKQRLIQVLRKISPNNSSKWRKIN
ncbi:MAG: DUF4835 family protein [Flavobacteriaceae bacterium]|nr:MAG: DUF4835 family protein [Flavobacteriaceae bacterium]